MSATEPDLPDRAAEHPSETLLDHPEPARALTPFSRRLRFIVPALVFLVIALVLGYQLGRQNDAHQRDLPSALIDKPMPSFTLPPVEGTAKGLSDADIRAAAPALVNIFASWCGPCRVEHPLWVALAKEGRVPVFGINYKDRPADAAGWLARNGNPYAGVGADLDGRVGIDWGVYGVPETFVIDREGRIVYKHVGVVMQRDLDQTLLPLLERLRQ
jgi:cytochrome c biogenesis protein CcmG/thiol:disulfide interchange protein DsbE